MWETIIFFLSLSSLRKGSQNTLISPPLLPRDIPQEILSLDRCEAKDPRVSTKDPRVSTKDRQVPRDLYLMLWRSKLYLISHGRGGFTVIRHLRVSVGPVVKDQVNQRASLLALNDPLPIESATRSKYRSKGSKVHCKAQWAYRVQSYNGDSEQISQRTQVVKQNRVRVRDW